MRLLRLCACFAIYAENTIYIPFLSAIDAKMMYALQFCRGFHPSLSSPSVPKRNQKQEKKKQKTKYAVAQSMCPPEFALCMRKKRVVRKQPWMSWLQWMNNTMVPIPIAWICWCSMIKRVKTGRKKERKLAKICALFSLYQQNSPDQKANGSRHHHLATRERGGVLKVRALWAVGLAGRQNSNPRGGSQGSGASIRKSPGESVGNGSGRRLGARSDGWLRSFAGLSWRGAGSYRIIYSGDC